jgi:HEAT repeat protein
MWEEALGSLKSLPPPDRPSDLVAELGGERSSEALLTLASSEPVPALQDSLRAALESDDPALRFRAAAALSIAEDRSAVPALLGALRDRLDLLPSPECRAIKAETPAWLPAMVLLARLGAAEAVPEISAVLEDGDASLDAMLAAVRSLGRIGDASGAPALEKLLAREDLPADRNLQSSSGALNAPPLDARWQLDLTAAEALGRMGIARRDLVEKHASDERALVRRRAAEVGRQLDAAGL